MESIVFGEYELLERIGVGGMAEVFRARARGDHGFSKIVAIKRIHPRYLSERMFVDMFVNEAKIAAELSHANIAKVYDLGCVDDRLYISMEHVHGRDLKTVFLRCKKEEGPLPIPEVCRVAMNVCDGLQYVHTRHGLGGENRQLIHRDISMQNILVSFEGEVKIIDFGVAKLKGGAHNTMNGMVKGKLAYMSPEQSRGLPLDGRSDIYSVGIVMYELLTGRRLFRAKTLKETVQRIRSGRVVPLRTYNQRVPAALEAIVLKALQRHPEDRYQTAAEMLSALRRFTFRHGQVCSRSQLAVWLRARFRDRYDDERTRLRGYEGRKEGTQIGWAPPARV